MATEAAGTLRVQLFASAREALGREIVELEWSETADVAALRSALAEAHPALAPLLSRCMIAVNQEYATPDVRVAATDEVAVLPPVSGGADASPPVDAPPPAVVTQEPLELAELMRGVETPRAGAIASFVGVVRDHNIGRSVHHLEYEGYPPMACREMDAIAAEAHERWPGCRVAMAHRIGRLEIGEASVIIACAAPHRAESFEACRYAIEELKRRVPIWKKEHFDGGAVWIETAADREPGAEPPTTERLEGAAS